MKKLILAFFIAVAVLLTTQSTSVYATHEDAEFFFDSGNHIVAGDLLSIRVETFISAGTSLTFELRRLDTNAIIDVKSFTVPALSGGAITSRIDYSFTTSKGDFYPFTLQITELDLKSPNGFVASLSNSIAASTAGLRQLGTESLFVVDDQAEYYSRLNDYTFPLDEYIVIWHRLTDLADSIAANTTDIPIKQQAFVGDVPLKLSVWNVSFASVEAQFLIQKPPEAANNPPFTILLVNTAGNTSRAVTSNTHILTRTGVFLVELARLDSNVDRFTGTTGTMAARVPDTEQYLAQTWSNTLGTWNIDGTGEAEVVTTAAGGPYTSAAITVFPDMLVTIFDINNFVYEIDVSLNIDSDAAMTSGSHGLIFRYQDTSNHWFATITGDINNSSLYTFNLGYYNADVLTSLSQIVFSVDDEDFVALHLDHFKDDTFTIYATIGDQDPDPLNTRDNVGSNELLFSFSMDDTFQSDETGAGLIADYSGVVAAGAIPATNRRRSDLYIQQSINKAEAFNYAVNNPIFIASEVDFAYSIELGVDVLAQNERQLVTVNHPDANSFIAFDSKVLSDTGTFESTTLDYAHTAQQTINLGTLQACCIDDVKLVSLTLQSDRIDTRSGGDYDWTITAPYTISGNRSVVQSLNRMSLAIGMGSTAGHIVFAFILATLAAVLFLQFSLVGSLIAGFATFLGLAIIGFLDPWVIIFISLLASAIGAQRVLTSEG